jgi:protoporphyrinogen oxidase/glycosyltransferase involved in cell wall biosynthesis
VPAAARSRGLLRSFWIAGFEGADHVNGAGVPLCMSSITQHLQRVEEDYAAVAGFGIRTVRESVGWRRCETKPRCYDFSSLERLAAAARVAGLEVNWALMHYGWPADLNVLSPSFPDRFAHFCEAAARVIRRALPDVPIYTPINEISFLSWALAETGLIDHRDETLRGQGFRIKRQLVRAALRAAEALWSVDPRARLLHTDPLIHIVAPADRPELAEEAARQRSYQFQAWDMLCGELEPELGGSRRMLDIVGVHYYHGNQWEHGTRERLHWHLQDRRRIPFSALLAEVHGRYRRPLVVSETSHVGEGRAQWLEEITDEVRAAEDNGVPVEGLCLYPVIGPPDWDDLERWNNSGLWDLIPDASGQLERRLCQPYAAALRRCQARVPERCTPAAAQADVTLIVFSHLRWDFVYQRPQHLMSRLAHHHRVLFVEEPMHHAEDAFFERFTPCANVEVLRPHTPVRATGFHDEQIPVLVALLEQFIQVHGIERHVAWLYTPMALPFASGMKPERIVYDCMDELAAFKSAPRQLMQRESALLHAADVVFTGGPSLYRAKRERHPAVHCFPSSVEQPHFEQARWADRHPAQAHLPAPRLGFCGVIDERMDCELLAAVADARPDWSLVMVGPFAKIDPMVLPRRHNIHWLGQRGYAELPRLMAGWDVCLMPFALNESTRHISPTKTLEYLAAGLPVVSTPVPDVVELYGEAVRVAGDAARFVAECEAALSETPGQRAERERRARALLARTSWDATVEQMRSILAQPPAHAAQSAPPASGARCERFEHIVVGAGPTGLSAACHLGAGSLLLERGPSVGGWCRSIQEGGFTFDYAGHIMFSKDPYVLELYQKLLGDNVHWQEREAWIHSKGVYTRYPFQGALYGLPPEVLKECIVGAIEARFGSLKAGPCKALNAPREPAAPRNFEEFIYKVWGAGVAKHFAIPYNRKLWAVPLDEMETSWLGGRVPLPDLEEMIEGALSPAPKPMGPNARFGYPLRGGFQALMDGFLPLLKGELRLRSEVRAVSPEQHLLQLTDGTRYRYANLISTLPLPKLVEAIGAEAPEEVRAAAAALRHVSVRCVNLGVGRARLSDKHWIYYPEDTVFHRIFLQGNASPHCSPPDGFGLTCEITYSQHKPLPCEGSALVRRCIEDCRRVGMLREDDRIVVANQVDLPIAYVVYDHERAANVERIRDWLLQHDIILAGRYAEWEYYNSDHAFIAGRNAAEQAQGVSAEARVRSA